MYAYHFKNGVFDIQNSDEEFSLAKERKERKLITQLKSIKVVNPELREIVDDKIDEIESHKELVHGRVDNLLFCVMRDEGWFFIHKVILDGEVAVFDSIRFYCEEDLNSAQIYEECLRKDKTHDE